jgi:drug/metabolite transporter (DMT)-like permease
MGKVSSLALWVNLLVMSGTWGSSFVVVKLITESMYPFVFAASRGFIAMAALLAWLASRRRALPAYGSDSLPRLWKTIGHMVVLGTTNGWPTNVLTATAVSHVDSAVVAMLQVAVPLMVAVLARERRAGVWS